MSNIYRNLLSSVLNHKNLMRQSKFMGDAVLDDAVIDFISEKIANLQVGDRFNLPQLLGDHWPQDVIDGRRLGRIFRKNLDAFQCIEDDGRDSANLRWYIKVMNR